MSSPPPKGQTPLSAGIEGGEKKYNTKNLGLRLAADATAAASAGVLVAPIITMIDKYVPSPSLL